MTQKEFKKGEVVFREGEFGESFFRVLEGCVGIFVNYGEAEEKKLTELSEGKIFGEMAVIESYPRSATAVSLADGTKVLEISDKELSAYMSENPEQVLGLMDHLSDRLRELTDDYTDVSIVIGEMKASEAEGRSQSLKDRIKKHVAAYKAKKDTVLPRSVEYFSDLAEIREMQKENRNLETYPAGTLICKEGDHVHCMYEIQTGRVGVYTAYGTPREQKLTELFPNTFFGEAGMISDRARSASVVALEETTVEIIRRGDLVDMFETNPPQAGSVLKHLSNRVRRLTNSYMQACELVYEAAEDEEKNGKMNPELAEKIKEYKADLYD